MEDNGNNGVARTLEVASAGIANRADGAVRRSASPASSQLCFPPGTLQAPGEAIGIPLWFQITLWSPAGITKPAAAVMSFGRKVRSR